MDGSAVLNEAMTTPVSVARLEESGHAVWDDYVRDHPEGSPFHLTAWRKAVVNALGYEAPYLVARRDRQVVGVLPLVHAKTRLFGNNLISTAFSVGGGLICDDDSVAEALSRRSTLDRLADPDERLDGLAAIEMGSRLRLAAYVSLLASQMTAAGYVATRHNDSVLIDAPEDLNLVPVVSTNEFRAETTDLLFSYLRPGRQDDDLTVIDDVPSDRLIESLAAHRVEPLTALLDRLPVSQHAGIYRRLGDLAAFTVGVFPDHGEAVTVTESMLITVLRTLPVGIRSQMEGATPTDLFGTDTVTATLSQLRPIWYRRAARSISWPAVAESIGQLAENFDVTVRFLQVLTGTRLVETRDDLFDFRLL